MDSIIELINLSLANLSNNNFIASLDEENPEAIQAAARWQGVLNSVLTTYPWDFATKHDDLAPAPGTPKNAAWRYHYLYPRDCVMIRRVYSPASPERDEPFQRGSLPENAVQTILANDTPLAAEFTRKDVLVSSMPPLFLNALSWRLSAEIALAQHADQEKYAMCIQAYGAILEEAKVADANESGPIAPVVGNWQRSRHG
ncbi:MAG: hypothetical protein LUC93_17690 [Planctomycetaceae bacterium]|nr:hypothetical protein [Planctomycetaceae bacterium]